MSNAALLNASNFDAAIASPTPTLVDFWAPWCGPCKMMLPVVEELAGELKGQAIVGKINVDEEAALAAKYDINSIPCFIIFKGGKETARLIGTQKKEELKKKLLG